MFCHTPSAADRVPSEGEVQDGRSPAAAEVSPRLAWWPSVVAQPDGAAVEFPTYDDIGSGAGVGSQSLACLSCHDGSQAFGIEGGLAVLGGPEGLSPPGVGESHPFGVPYRGALEYAPLEASAETLEEARTRRASRFPVNEADFRPARYSVINQRDVWWVPTSESGVARTRKDLPLYVRSRQSAINNKVPFIECSSCHDPHSSAPLFLRVSNSGADGSSRLCLSCHEK